MYADRLRSNEFMRNWMICFTLIFVSGFYFACAQREIRN